MKPILSMIFSVLSMVLLKDTPFKYGYLLKETVLSMVIYLRISIHKHFSSWFLIGKNYIFHLENIGFSTKQYTYELTNIIVDVFKIHVISGNQ